MEVRGTNDKLGWLSFLIYLKMLCQPNISEWQMHMGIITKTPYFTDHKMHFSPPRK